MSLPKLLLHFEGAAVLIGSVALYTQYGGSWWLSLPLLLAIGLIWIAHIGMDRMMGYGLKYPTQFKDTHFSRV